MSGKVSVVELDDRLIDEPAVPEYYSRPARAAFRRGVMARARRPWATSSPYSQRYMQLAWTAGWDAVGKGIAEAPKCRCAEHAGDAPDCPVHATGGQS